MSSKYHDYQTIFHLFLLCVTATGDDLHLSVIMDILVTNFSEGHTSQFGISTPSIMTCCILGAINSYKCSLFLLSIKLSFYDVWHLSSNKWSKTSTHTATTWSYPGAIESIRWAVSILSERSWSTQWDQAASSRENTTAVLTLGPPLSPIYLKRENSVPGSADLPTQRTRVQPGTLGTYICTMMQCTRVASPRWKVPCLRVTWWID